MATKKKAGTIKKSPAKTAPANNKAQFDAWFKATLKALIGSKQPPTGINALLKALVEKMPKGLTESKTHLTRSRVYKELLEMFKSKCSKLMLRDAVKARLSAEKLLEQLKRHHHGNDPLPPLWWLEEILNEMHGRVSSPHRGGTSKPGILRLPFLESKAADLSITEVDKPFHAIPKHKSDRVRFAVIAAPQLGLLYDPEIEFNLTRCGLAAARRLECDAIVMGGGLFRINLQKTAGPNRLLDDFVNGIQIDLESLAENYREEAKQILATKAGKPLFVTAQERFTELLRGWYKLAIRPDNKGPEFTDKPIYIVLGPDDIALGMRITYFEILYQQHQRSLEANAFARLKAKLAAELYEELVQTRQSGEDVSGIQALYDEATDEAEEAAHLASRFRMTNLESGQDVMLYQRALGYLIGEIEKSIPNAKVIAEDRAYAVFGDNKNVVKLACGGGDANPHYAELATYGPAQREGKLPALTIVMHPRALYYRETARENYRDGTMIVRPSVFVEAPMLVDAGLIRRAARGKRINLPVVKAVKDPRFEAGMIVVNLHPDREPTIDYLRAEAVRKLGAKKDANHKRTPPKMLWMMVCTDMHFGGPNRLFIRRPTGVPIGLAEASLELMRPYMRTHKGWAPVHCFISADDAVNGNHFGTDQRPHRNRRTNTEVLFDAHERLEAVEKMRSPKRQIEELKALVRAQSDQIRVRTPDHMGSQLKEIEKGLMIPYRDVFKGVILRAHYSGVTVGACSDLTGQTFDTADVGIIDWPSGNHANKTVDDAVYEGELLASLQRGQFRDDPDLVKLGLNVDRLIRAPLSQDRTTGYGTIQVGKKGYVWGLNIEGTPPVRDSWLDTVHGFVKADLRRGNPSTIFGNMSVIHITGDKHFKAVAFATGHLWVMGAPNTHTDAFADIAGGLPENNAGTVFIGVPVDGPDAGEIKVVHLTPSVMQDYLNSGEEFPWDEFLPNGA